MAKELTASKKKTLESTAGGMVVPAIIAAGAGGDECYSVATRVRIERFHRPFTRHAEVGRDRWRYLPLEALCRGLWRRFQPGTIWLRIPMERRPRALSRWRGSTWRAG